MASNIIPFPRRPANDNSPQQPDLRSFIVYEHVPLGCVPFVVTDSRSHPHLRPGDIALVDTRDREPVEDELFVIQWSDGGRDVVQAYCRAGRYGCGPNGEMIDSKAWWVGAYNRPRSYEEAVAWGNAGRPIQCVDGPYATEGSNSGYLQSKLVGRVIGILEPAFAEPLRLAA